MVLLKGPVQPISLASSILSSVRARRCQYAVCAHLVERRQAGLALKALAAARTSEIEAADVTRRFESAEQERVKALLHQQHRVKVVS